MQLSLKLSHYNINIQIVAIHHTILFQMNLQKQHITKEHKAHQKIYDAFFQMLYPISHLFFVQDNQQIKSVILMHLQVKLRIIHHMIGFLSQYVTKITIELNCKLNRLRKNLKLYSNILSLDFEIDYY